MFTAAASYAVLTAALALRRFDTFHNHTFDLALHARMAWGVVHGVLSEPIIGGHFLSGHVPLVLVPLGALGAVFGTVRVLLVAQSVAVALSAFVFYRSAVRHLPPVAALVFGAAFMLQPNLGHVTTYEMHPGTLALLPLCLALDAFDRRRPVMLMVWVAAVVACRASLALQTCVLGVLACLEPGPMRRAGLGVVLGSVTYFGFVQGWLTPRFGASLHGSLDLHFGRWGGSPAGIATALFTRPGDVLNHFANWRRLSYLLRILAPLAFLPLAAPRLALCALPPLALNLISEFPTTTELYSHYLTPALPPLAWASLHGAMQLAQRGASARRAILIALIGASLAAQLYCGGLPWSRDFAAPDFRLDAWSASARAIVQAISQTASVQAPDALLAHLSERERVLRGPPPERDAEYVVLDTRHRQRFAQQETLLRTTEEPIARSWLARSDYGLTAAAPGLLLFQRGASARIGPARRYRLPPADFEGGSVPLGRCLALERARMGDALELELRVLASCPSDLALRFGPDASASRVDLMFDGLLSPASLQPGERVWSQHPLSNTERTRIAAAGLWLGLLRANGAPLDPADPRSVAVRLTSP